MKGLILTFLILLNAGSSICLSQNQENRMSFTYIEKSAEFDQGDLSTFQLWVYKNLKYPEKALEDSMEGKTILSFMVDSSGNVKDIKILRTAGLILDNAAEKVVESSPKWKPAKQGNKNIGIFFTLPIEYKMTDKYFLKQIGKLSKQKNKSNEKKYNR